MTTPMVHSIRMHAIRNYTASEHWAEVADTWHDGDIYEVIGDAEALADALALMENHFQHRA